MLTSNDTTGALCISQPWPGMARTIHNDHQRFIETYCQPHPGIKSCFYCPWMVEMSHGRCSETPCSLSQQVISLLAMVPIVPRRGITRSLGALMMSST